MSESNSDVTDEGKKEHKGDEGEGRITSGTMDLEHKGERERNKTTRSPLHGRLLVVIRE